MSTFEPTTQWKECLHRLADEWRFNGSIDNALADGVMERAQQAIAAGVDTTERVFLEGDAIAVSWWWLAMWMQNTDMIKLGLNDAQGVAVLTRTTSTQNQDVAEAWLRHPTMSNGKSIDFLRTLAEFEESIKQQPRFGKIVAEQVSEGRNHKHNIEVINWMTQQQWNMSEAYGVLKKSKFYSAEQLAQSLAIMQSQVQKNMLKQELPQRAPSDKPRSVRKI